MIHVFWTCPNCDTTHHWTWDDCDFQDIGSPITMWCEKEELPVKGVDMKLINGCGEKTPMEVFVAEETQSYGDYEDTGIMIMMTTGQKILEKSKN